jgi:[acyl-carrier-protein] S-malonyltransferase
MNIDAAILDAGATAWVFPGQGAQHASMLEPLRNVAGFDEHYDRVCRLVNRDVLAEARQTPERLNRNVDSSLLTVLASVLCLERIREAADVFPKGVAGYSVGQWTALYAAGAISVDRLFRLVLRRAQLMDAYVAALPPSGMLAVIGVSEADVRRVCDEIARAGPVLEITNENAPSQFSLAGTLEALQLAEVRLAEFRPKRLQRIPVAGPWHSSLLAPVVPQLRAILEEVNFAPLRVPVIDNTTGDWLPTEPARCKDALAAQVAAPVLWSRGIRTLIGGGVRQLIEVGYGDLLTKFGFFIDRSVRHTALVPAPRGSA